ncbi:MAG: hypothetical protein LBG90_01960 [Spirochaetaceae bacterium]|jgi:hypothetical protein|nr:hypothetical protein [Spirochaetaceae bacterium]
MRLFLLLLSISAISGQEVLRGEVQIDIEPIHGAYADESYPLDAETVYRRGLEESALFYGAMIYGWSFEYDVGERARGIAEAFELTRLGGIPFGDPGLHATDVKVRDMRLHLWTDYRLNPEQQRRIAFWKSGGIRTAQAVGHGPLGNPSEQTGWLDIKKAALEDAARLAVRTLLRGTERNRPKEVRGYISLSSFPNFWIDSGQWAVSARFRVEITEILPFAAH